MLNLRPAVLLLRTAHPEPTVAVSTLAALLAAAAGLGWPTIVLLAAAVFAGQLSIGWSNDVIDLARDRAVQRDDKPLVTGALSSRTVWCAAGVALAVCVVLSLWCGVGAGLVHLVLLVGSGWAYNLGLKRTVWSWSPYAVAFGSLPVFVSLSADPATIAPVWMMLAGAMLGVGAHLVNVLPDLEDDARTGVRGFPHRLGRRGAQGAATAILSAASLAVVVGPVGRPSVIAWVCLGAVVCLATLGLARADHAFRAAVGIALVDVVMLLIAR